MDASCVLIYYSLGTASANNIDRLAPYKGKFGVFMNKFSLLDYRKSSFKPKVPWCNSYRSIYLRIPADSQAEKGSVSCPSRDYLWHYGISRRADTTSGK